MVVGEHNQDSKVPPTEIPLYIFSFFDSNPLYHPKKYITKIHKYVPFSPVVAHELQYLEQMLKVSTLTFICLKNRIGA